MLSPPIMQPTIILWVFFEKRTISFATRIGSEMAEGTAMTNAMSQSCWFLIMISNVLAKRSALESPTMSIGFARLQSGGSTASSS